METGTSAVDLDAVKQREFDAFAMVSALCKRRGSNGSREWIMSIPARPDYDPDLIICASLRDINPLTAELTQARAQVATLEARVMVLYAALRSEAIVPCGRMPDKGDEPMLVSHRCNVCWTEWELEEPESHKADCPLSAIPGSPDINGETNHVA